MDEALTSFYYGYAHLYEDPTLTETATSILNSRILNSPPPLRIYLDL
jgi:hypothetical protein